MKHYKVSMLIAAAVTAILMAWCGVTATVTAPVLALYAVEEHCAVGILMLTVLGLSGMITAQLSRRMPSPFPQLLVSAALGTGYTAVTAWMNGRTSSQLGSALEDLILRSFQVSGLILPTIVALSAFFSLPAFFEKNIRRKSHALLNLFTLLALIVTADSIMAILDLPGLRWQQLAYSLSILSISRYRNMLQTAVQEYTSIPLLFRLIAGSLCLLVLGRAQYIAGLRKLQRRSAAVRSRPITPPPARSIVAAARPAEPVSRSVASAVQRSQPRSTGISARDSAMLDALAAQTISGRPIGLNIATGIPNITGI